jgi:hypothetical protein
MMNDGPGGVSVTRMGVQTVVSGADEAGVHAAVADLLTAGAHVVLEPRLVGAQWMAVCEGVPEAGAYRW